MSQHSVRRFKKLALEDIPQALERFQRQQLATQWHLSPAEQLALS